MPLRPVNDPALLQQLNGPQTVAPNPMFPGQMQGQGLQNAGQGLQNQTRAAELPYVAPKAAADAANAATQARINAATAPAEVVQKGAAARKAAVDAQVAQANLATSGGADSTQAKNASFYTRAVRANQMYTGTGVTDLPYSHELALKLLPDALVNKYTSKPRQVAEAAQRDFVASTLRYESGAAITDSEFENQRKIYFPEPNDSPEKIAAKAQLRMNAIEGLKAASGPAAPLLDAQQPSGPAYAPAPTGPDASMGSSKDGFSDTPDPASAAFWEDAARKGTPYGTALRQWQSDVGARGLQGVTPPPPEGYNKARSFIRQNPNIEYHPFNSIQRTPLSTLESLTNAISSSGPGAAAGHFANAATAGLPERLAGDQGQYFDAVSRAEHPVASTLGDIGGFTAGALGANKVLGSVAPKLGALGGFLTKTPGRQGLISDMAFGGATGAVQTPDNPLLGAGEGALAMGGGNLLGRGLANTAASLVSPTGGRLASLYDMGVRPSIGQRAGGLVNNFEEKFQSIPFVGDMIQGTRQKARDQFQVGLFNDALGEIGQKLPKGMEPGHAPHQFAQQAFSKAYDSAERGMTAVADAPLGADLGNLQKTVSGLSDASQKQFDTIWTASVGRRFKLGSGALSGNAYKDAMSELSKKAAALRKNPTGDHELASALDDAMSALRGSAARNSSPQAVAALDAADRGYAKLVRIEAASRKAGGDAATFNPVQYNSAVKETSGGIRNRGYLAGNALNSDIAAKGLSLQDVVSSSGTFDRYAPAAAMMAGSFFSPKAAVGLGTYAALNAPGIRGLTTGLLAPRGIRARTLADILRGQSGNVGTLGGSVGLSLLPPR